MRRMADSVNAADLPAGWDLYGAYIDGRYQTYSAAVARFGAAKVVGIAVFSSTNGGIVGDCESGDMTPQTAVSWVLMRRASGVDPTIYCSLAAWPAVQSAFNAAKVAQPHYWIAAYPGNGELLYPGSSAHQYADTGGYDASVVADYWPGVDPAPSNTPPPPPATHYQEDDMQSIPINVAMSGGKGWVPSPVPAAKVVNVVMLTENPDVVERYDNVPIDWAAATEAGKNSPNGALVIEGLMPDGTYGAVVWAAN